MLNHQFETISASPQARSREMVMMHFQQTMLQMTQYFISTQQAVMLCYLQEAPHTQGTTSSAQTSSRQFLHLGEPTVQREPCDAIIEEPLKVFGFNQQSLTDDQVSSVPASENFGSPSSHLGIATDAVTPELNNEELVASLMDLISERTGYPVDMIDPGLDLESDLGIDSIKRIEILNKFQSVLPLGSRALLENSLEELASARTVNQIIESIIKAREASEQVST